MRKVFIVLIFLCALFLSTPIAEAANSSQLIVINKSNNKLAFFNNGKLVRTFNVATGRDVSFTPEGKFRIVNKIVNRPYYKENIPGGDPLNPLGDRWLGLEAKGTYGTTYGIHGNNNENSIGKYVSSGCIRMHNNEVRWLFPQVNLYTTVIITRSTDSFPNIAAQNGYKVNQEQVNYYEAVKAGEQLLQKLQTFKHAIDSGSIENINTSYNEITHHVQITNQKIGKVSGKKTRDTLGNKYVRPAKISIERTIYEISQYRLLENISLLLDKQNLNKAKSEMAKLDRLKQRAIAIKQAGNYAPLPQNIKHTLDYQTAKLYGQLLSNRLLKYQTAINTGINSINDVYDTITTELRLTEGMIGKVYGPANRSTLNNSYINPGKIAIERTIYEVSMFRLMKDIEQSLNSNQFEKAKKDYAKLGRLKNRAAEIKDAGGYQPLPNIVVTELTKIENELLDKLGKN